MRRQMRQQIRMFKALQASLLSDPFEGERVARTAAHRAHQVLLDEFTQAFRDNPLSFVVQDKPDGPPAGDAA